ncbi:hypothetical protein QR98_0060490 [Sarcoptes scabiei]|uniref:E3 ubiquitin-protein ligase Hakai n=1 Tax=Sarcoptes scabiei TaxID=52283 RepID=A0A132A9C2_SARSC|nr:hypothetical protein QR98_0060490 [Sarcoptes scabiei]
MDHHHYHHDALYKHKTFSKHDDSNSNVLHKHHSMIDDNGDCDVRSQNDIVDINETDFVNSDPEFFNFNTLISPLSTLPFVQSNKMQWKNRANLVGEKILNPSIHICEECSKPILIYGRMIPCKHVFCYECANKSQTECLRCSEEIFKIEKCNLGTVFICRNETCKRTYLSQRDLEAHIKHRHVRKSDLLSRL